MTEPTEKFESQSYIVTHYRQDPLRLIVAFASAGQWGAGEPIEEFKTTLLRTGVSAVFVICRAAEWYNHPETAAILEMLATLASQYRYAGAIGESMGGSGALMLAGYTSHISRILSFAPQYSILPPFIDFDPRYRDIGHYLPRHYWSDFAFEGTQARVVILAGTTEIPDAVHTAMFISHGFKVTWVQGAGHEVARYLKMSPLGNQLQSLVDRFCDFGRPFDAAALDETLGQTVARAPVRHLLDALRQPDERRLAPGLDLALGKRATQSSLSPWSIGTLEDDASRAVSAFFSPDFSFHTGEEQDPWWEVDLGEVTDISEIWIFTRPIHSERFKDFKIELSYAKTNRVTVFASDPGALLSASPFIWKSPTVCRARFVRISLDAAMSVLHLSGVQVFGPAANSEALPAAEATAISPRTLGLFDRLGLASRRLT